MDHIKSPQNSTFKMLKSLASSKGLKKEKKCIVSGKNIIREVKALQPNSKLIHFKESLSPDILLDKVLFQSINPLKNNDPILLAQTSTERNIDLKSPLSGLEVMLPVGDPKNLGALIRTALAFNASKIILLKESAHPFLPEAIKSSSGSVFKAPLFYGPSIKSLLSDPNLYTLDMNGTPISSSNLNQKKLRLLVGEEGGRLSKELKRNSLSIPISTEVESLNVNSCLSIALYELTRGLLI